MSYHDYYSNDLDGAAYAEARRSACEGYPPRDEVSPDDIEDVPLDNGRDETYDYTYY